MKKIFCLASLLLLTSTTIHAEGKCGTAIGNTVMHGATMMQCQKITGAATLNQSTMHGTLTVIGNLSAKQSTLLDIDITGDVNLLMSAVDGKSKITGQLNATKTTFADSIELTGKTATFHTSYTRGIIINSKKPAYIYLDDHSVVDGDITFTNGDGIVKNTNSIIHGKVIGGKIEK